MHTTVRPHGGRLAALLVFASTMTGCVNAAAYNTENRASLLRRASFDFRCPETGLTTVALRQNEYAIITSAGVEGCGHRGSYVLKGWSGDWVANVMDGQTSGGEAPSVSPPAGAPAP